MAGTGLVRKAMMAIPAPPSLIVAGLLDGTCEQIESEIEFLSQRRERDVVTGSVCVSTDLEKAAADPQEASG